MTTTNPIQALCRVADDMSKLSDDVPFEPVDGRTDEQHGDQFDGGEQ